MASGRSVVTATTLRGRAGALAAARGVFGGEQCGGRGRAGSVRRSGLAAVPGTTTGCERSSPAPLLATSNSVRNAGATRPPGRVCCSFPTCPPLAGDSGSVRLRAARSACWHSSAGGRGTFESGGRSTGLLSKDQNEPIPPCAGTELSKCNLSLSPGKIKGSSFSSARSSPAPALREALSAAAGGWDRVCPASLLPGLPRLSGLRGLYATV